MTLSEAIEMIARGETPEQYGKRVKRIRRLVNERDDLTDALSVLDPVDDADRYAKKRKRLDKVIAEIESLC